MNSVSTPDMPPRAEAGAAVSQRKKPGRVRRWLPLLGLVLLGWVLSRLDRGALAGAFGQISAGALALSCAWFGGNAWLKVLRWQRLLHSQDIALPHRVALAAFLSSQFYAQVTVGRVGEFMRIEALLERGVRPGTALAACVFDRLLDVFVVLSLGVVLGSLGLGDRRVAYAAGALLIVLTIFGLWALRLLGRAEPPRLLAPIGRSRFGARVLGFVRELAQGVLPMLRPRALAEAMFWTLIAWYGYFAALFALADGLGIVVSRVLLTATAAFAALSSLLPITISGLGARELIYIEVLRRSGVPGESAAALSLLHLGVMSGMAIVLGFAGSVWRARQRA
jgi:glycosyltransferase 2 family protein